MFNNKEEINKRGRKRKKQLTKEETNKIRNDKEEVNKKTTEIKNVNKT